MDSHDVEACIGRSGVDSDIHIVIHYNDELDYSRQEAELFVEGCSPFSSRWKSLTITGDWEHENDADASTIGGEMVCLMGNMPLLLPRLRELCIRDHHRDLAGKLWWRNSKDSFVGEVVVWRMPNIRVLRCSQYIPPPSFPYETLASFTLNFTLSPGMAVAQVTDLCVFLLGRTSLRELDLNLNKPLGRSHLYEPEDVLQFNTPLSLQSLESFRLSIDSIPMRMEGLPWLPQQILRLLYMPNLKHYTLSTDFLKLPLDLIPDPAIHSRLSSLTIEAPRPGDTGALLVHVWATMGRRDSELLIVPLEKFPGLTELNITTLNSLLFSREDTRDGNIITARQLRVLRLRSCNEMDSEGLWWAVKSLKDLDVWDFLDRVVIHNCKLLDFDTATAIVGEEKLMFSRS